MWLHKNKDDFTEAVQAVSRGLNISPALVETVTAGGESGSGARLCRFEWIKRISADCAATGVAFSYHQTGALLEVNGRVWHIPRRLQAEQAKRAGVDVCGTQKE